MILLSVGLLAQTGDHQSMCIDAIWVNLARKHNMQEGVIRNQENGLYHGGMNLISSTISKFLHTHV